jgi:uncharacterized membrane protein
MIANYLVLAAGAFLLGIFKFYIAASIVLLPAAIKYWYNKRKYRPIGDLLKALYAVFIALQFFFAVMIIYVILTVI